MLTPCCRLGPARPSLFRAAVLAMHKNAQFCANLAASLFEALKDGAARAELSLISVGLADSRPKVADEFYLLLTKWRANC